MHDTDRDALSRDATFDLLSNPRRRFIISYLERVGRPVSVTDLATEVTAWEEDEPVESIDRQERKRVYVSLYQTHVPKLDDAGVVEYDEEVGTVALADPGHGLSEYLVRPDSGRDWARYYLAVALAGAAAYLALAFDALGLAAVPDAAAIGLVVVASAAVAAAQFASADSVPAPGPRR